VRRVGRALIGGVKNQTKRNVRVPYLHTVELAAYRGKFFAVRCAWDVEHVPLLVASLAVTNIIINIKHN
jgi:hypothetical protein